MSKDRGWRDLIPDEQMPPGMLAMTCEQFVRAHRDRYKPARDWEICVRYYAGEPLPSIAADYDLTPEMVGHVAHELGLPRRKRGPVPRAS